MRNLLLSAAACFPVMISSSFAETAPQAGPFDPRITYVDYNVDDVTLLQGAYMVSTLIRLAPDETIFAITAGDTIGWEISPIGANIVAIKPRENPTPTTMQVVTTRQNERGIGEERIYHFMLTASPEFVARQTRGVQFQINFRYPLDEAAREAVAAEEAELKTDLDAVTAESAERVNLSYLIAGASSLEPSEAFDNGHFTYLKYPGNRPMPAVYEADEVGAEALVNFHVEGEWLVVHQTASRLVLRKGGAVACLFNHGGDAQGTNRPNGAESPWISRAVKPTPAEQAPHMPGGAP